MSKILRKGVVGVVEEHLHYNFRVQSFSIGRESAELQRLKRKLASSVADLPRLTPFLFLLLLLFSMMKVF
jgi:hypothetical protein